MFSEFLFLFGTLWLAADGVVTLPQINACFYKKELAETVYVEKSLCYVKREATAYQAKQLCKQYGMNLYDRGSSENDGHYLLEFGKTVFKGNRKAMVYIAGRIGNRCEVVTGDQRYVHVSCSLSFHFLCDYRPTVYNCDSIQESGDGYDNLGLFSTDLSCNILTNSIVNPSTTFTSNDPENPNEVIKYLRIQERNCLFFPINLGEKFPNLMGINAEKNQIKALTRLNLGGLTNLVYLGLLENQITSLLSDVFAEVPNLGYLDLVSNPLQTISADLFSVTLGQLQNVYLNGCINASAAQEREKVAGFPQSETNTCTTV